METRTPKLFAAADTYVSLKDCSDMDMHPDFAMRKLELPGCAPNSPIRRQGFVSFPRCVGVKFANMASSQLRRECEDYGRFTYARIAAKPGKPAPKIYSLTPHVQRGFVISKSSVREISQHLSSGNVCEYCGVVFPQKYGHEAICMAPAQPSPSYQYGGEVENLPRTGKYCFKSLESDVEGWSRNLNHARLQGLGITFEHKLPAQVCASIDNLGDKLVECCEAIKATPIAVKHAVDLDTLNTVIGVSNNFTARGVKINHAMSEGTEMAFCMAVDEAKRTAAGLKQQLKDGVRLDIKLPQILSILPFGKELGKFIDTFVDMVKSAFSVVGNILNAFIAVPIAAAYLFVSKYCPNLPGYICDCLDSAWLFLSGGTSLAEMCGEDESTVDVDDFVVQSGVSDSIATVLTAVTSPLFAGFLLPGTVAKHFEGVGRLHKQYNNWSQFADFFVDNFFVVLSKLASLVGVTIKSRVDEIAEVESFVARCETFCIELRVGGLTPDHAIATQYKALEMHGLNLSGRFNKDHEVLKVINVARNKLKEASTMLGGLLSSTAGMRAPPVSRAFIGSPGEGKTSALQPIVTDLLGRMLTPSEVENLKGSIFDMVYTHNGGDFWDGYFGQPIHFVDDAFQKRVVTGATTDEFNDVVVKVINPAPLPLNMADLASKGRFHYISRVCLMTTNALSIKSEAEKVVASTLAVARRFKAYQLVLRPDWKNKVPDKNGIYGLNVEKLKEHLASDTDFATPDAWLAQEWDIINGKAFATEPISIHQVIEEIIQDLEYTEKTQQTISDACKDIFKRRWEKLHKSEAVPVCEPVLQAGSICGGDLGHEEPEIECGEEFHDSVDFEEELNAGEIQAPLSNIMKALENPRSFSLSRFDGAYRSSFVEPRETLASILCKAKAKLAEWITSPIGQAAAWIAGGAFAFKFVFAPAFTALFRVLFVGKESVVDADATELGKGLPYVIRQNANYILSKYEPSDFIIPGALAGTKPVYGPGAHVDINRRARLESSGVAVKLQGNSVGTNVWAIPHMDPTVPQCVEDVMLRWKENVYWIYYKNNLGVESRLGTCLFVKGQSAIMNGHFMHQLLKVKDAGGMLILRQAFGKGYELTMTVQTMISAQRFKSTESDIIGVVLYASRMHPDITKFFLKASEHGTFGSTRAVLVTPAYGDVEERYVFTKATYSGELSSHSKVGFFRGIYWYSAPTVDGDCGSALFATEGGNLGCRRILGVHMGLSDEERSDSSFATIVTSDMLQDWTRNEFCPVLSNASLHGVKMIPSEDLPMEGSFMPCARLVGKEHNCARVSQKKPVIGLIDSFGKVFPLTKRPAKLTPFVKDGKVINPMHNALAKVALPVSATQHFLVGRAVKEVEAHIKLCTTPVKACVPPVWSINQALSGVVCGERKLEPIDRSSGPGFPYCLSGDGNAGQATKWSMTSDDVGEYCASPHLCEVVTKVIDDARKGVRNEHIYVDFLKDELRPIDKVYEGKSRLISSCPLPLLVATRMMFGEFTSAMMQCKSPQTNLGICVGINPYTDWDALIRPIKLLGGGKVIAGDFSGFDATETSYIHNAILEIINDWYDDGYENRLARRILWLEVTNSYHLNAGEDGKRNLVYQWVHSLPSGHPMTTIINSLYNMICFVFCFLMRVPEGNFFRDTCIRFYGDDNFGSISPSLIGRFNQQTIQEDAKILGLNYTDDTKGGEIQPYKDLLESTFLKRTAWFDESVGCWLGALDIHSTLEQVYWTRGNPTDALVKANVDRAFYELSMHPIEVWRKYAGPLEEAFAKCYPYEVRQGHDESLYQFWRHMCIGVSKQVKP